jgi:hypothetical protein
MSAKELIYGVVATVVPNCTGVDGGTYTGYIVQKSHFGGTVIGHSIKNVSFVPGDVVRIVQCGESLPYGSTDVPLHGWGFLPYASDYPTVLQVPEYSLVRDIETNPRHAATASLNWLCRKAGCIDKLYWPARITGISGSIATVCDQFGAGAYQMPVSSDLSISDFSVGDYVLVYSPSSGEEVIGWWMMAPGMYTEYNRYTAAFVSTWQAYFPGGELYLTFNLGSSFTFAAPNITYDFPAGTHSSATIGFKYDDPIPAGRSIGYSITVPVPVGGWKSSMWPMTLSSTGYYYATNTMDPRMFYTA